jgi:hypothetical protein
LINNGFVDSDVPAHKSWHERFHDGKTKIEKIGYWFRYWFK